MLECGPNWKLHGKVDWGHWDERDRRGSIQWVAHEWGHHHHCGGNLYAHEHQHLHLDHDFYSNLNRYPDLHAYLFPILHLNRHKNFNLDRNHDPGVQNYYFAALP